MQHRKYGMMTSSQDPEAIANKVKGVVLGLSSLIILFAGAFFHLQLSAGDVISLATELGTLAGAIWAIYGSILNIIAWYYARKNAASLPA